MNERWVHHVWVRRYEKTPLVTRKTKLKWGGGGGGEVDEEEGEGWYVEMGLKLFMTIMCYKVDDGNVVTLWGQALNKSSEINVSPISTFLWDKCPTKEYFFKLVWIYPSYDKCFNYQPKFPRWKGIGSMISLRILQHFLRDNIQEVAMLPHFFILSLQLFIHFTIKKLQLFNHYVNSNPLCKLFPNFFLHFLVCILGFSFIV